MSRLIAIVLVIALSCIFISCISDGTNNASEGNNTLKERTPEELYNKHCRLCHGKEGDKMLSGAKDLSTSSLTQDERVSIITKGKGAMAAYNEKMSAEEIAAVAIYVEGLRSDD